MPRMEVSNTATRKSQVLSFFSQITSEMTQLGGAIDEIEKKLEPVLRPASKVCSQDPKQERSDLVPLADSLRNLAIQISRHQSQLVDVLERLEL